MRDENDIDELIDRALARYAEAEPLDGLAGRVLQRVRREHRNRAFRWIAAVAVACSLLVAVMEVPRPRSTGPNVDVREDSESVVMLPPIPGAEQVTFAIPKHPTMQRRALPKQPVFPGDEPITAEESALVRLASYTNMSFSEAPLNVEPIKVQLVDVAPIVVNESNPNF